MKGFVVGYRAWRLNVERELLMPCINYLAPAWEAEGWTEAVCVPLPGPSWTNVMPPAVVTSSHALNVQFRYSVTASSNSWSTPAYGTQSLYSYLVPDSESEPDSKHEIVDTHCHCGLYAYPKMPSCWMLPTDDWDPFVLGASLNYGPIEAHGNGIGLEGFRAQYAKPVVLLQQDVEKYKPIVSRIAARVGASVVNDWDALLEQTREFTHIKEAVGWEPGRAVFRCFTDEAELS